MTTQYSKFQRVGVFVDVQNMFYSAKNLRKSKLNFAKLMEKAVRGRQLIRAICYCVQSPDSDQSSFTDMLRNNGYEIKMKDVRQRADGFAKADGKWRIKIGVEFHFHRHEFVARHAAKSRHHSRAQHVLAGLVGDLAGM